MQSTANVTVEEIRSECEQAKPSIDDFMNCGYISRVLQTRLDERGVDSELIEGSICQTRSDREEHAYLEIPADAVAGESSPVIVDGSISQFCELNHPDVWVVLGEKEELPDVAVLAYGDQWYAYYSRRQP